MCSGQPLPSSLLLVLSLGATEKSLALCSLHHPFMYLDIFIRFPLSILFSRLTYSLRLALCEEHSRLFNMLVTFKWSLPSIAVDIMADFFHKSWCMSGSYKCICYRSRYYKYNRTTGFPIPSFVLLCFY